MNPTENPTDSTHDGPAPGRPSSDGDRRRPPSLPVAAVVATAGAVLLAALNAGFFGTYEHSVTDGLALTSDATYVESFQRINETVRTPWFAVVFFGVAPIAALAAGLLAAGGERLAAALAAAAAVVAVTGVLAVTLAGNVPLNEQLAVADTSTPGSVAAARADFEQTWNQLNTVRTWASHATAALLAGALVTAGLHRDRAGAS